MQINCRVCGQPIRGEDVNIAAAVAKCNSCQAVFQLQAPQHTMGNMAQMPGYAAPPSGGPWGGMMPVGGSYGPSTTRGAVPMPPGITVEAIGSDLTIHRSWFGWGAVFLVFFCLIWDTVVSAFIIGGVFGMFHGVGPMGILFLLIPGLFAVIGLLMTYYCLCCFVNSTTIRANQGELTVSHGPLPWFGGVLMPSSEVTQFYVSEQVHHHKRSISYTYSVEMFLRSGIRQKLVENLEDATQALYIEQQLEGHLKIADQRVAGELPRW